MKKNFFGVKSINPAILVTVVAFGSLDPFKLRTVSTVTGIVGVGVRNPGTCRRFWTLGSSCMEFLKVSTVTGIVGVGVRNPGTYRQFGPRA